jgi:hypothetical protein
MARISGVSAGEMGQELAATVGYLRHGMAEMAGSAPERGIEPVEILAHAPGLLRGLLARSCASTSTRRSWSS